jgi:cobalt-zinc-cadmium efflux system protein
LTVAFFGISNINFKKLGNHHHSSNSKAHENQKKLGFTIFLNIFITIVQIAGGFISGSLSLLSDALHNFSDVISLIISYLASTLLKKHQTSKQTFGYKRAEVVAAFINTVILIIVAVLLIFESIKRFKDPVVIDSGWVIGLAIGALIINGISALILNRGSKENMNIRSAYLHLLSDAFTSLAVLIGGVLIYFYKFYWIDGALTLLIAVYLIFVSWKLLLESLKVLMLFTPSSIVIETINEEISTIPEIRNIHHVHVWQLDNDQIYFEGHVDFVDNLTLQKVNEILGRIQGTLHEHFNIEHVTLQPEFNRCQKKDLISQGH